MSSAAVVIGALRVETPVQAKKRRCILRRYFYYPLTEQSCGGGYRVCPVRMYVSTYVRSFVRSYVHLLSSL